ncbi:hypothetical protein AlacWU_10354 [Aspergillus niger]|nr:hypothetical protein AlacWU_10354 [Aspergillus niger]
MTTLTNNGDGPLQVPGFGSIPLDFQLPPEARFAHGLLDYRHSPRLTKREMAMLRLMQQVTEQPGWDSAVINEDEVQLAQWYRDATEGPDGHLISAAAWDWCLAELRDKAETWRETGRLLVFDSSSAVCQADVSLHLERLIASSVPSWNEILFYGNTRGCRPPRILTYGCEVHDYKGEEKLFNALHHWPRFEIDTDKEWETLRNTAREYIGGPEPPKWKQAEPLPDKPTNLMEMLTPEQWDVPGLVYSIARHKRTRRAWFDHPNPGVSFSYEQWKQGEFTGRAVHVQRLSKYPDPLHHDHKPVQLEKQFRKKGLQVVVEITRIEIHPDNPIFNGERHFHTEGLRNDRIAATSLYVVECNNITPARLAFEHEDKVHASELECQVPRALAAVLDVDSWEWYEDNHPRALHAFGSVPLTEGRLLSWPNTYRSKLESFRLENPIQPGNLTLIKLRLVDPHYRICSTLNVPPQQNEWWAAAARQAAGLDQRLPLELVWSVMDHLKDWPISAAEAEDLRIRLLFEHERVRRVIDSCVGHHIVNRLPYDEEEARSVREVEIGMIGYESP